MTSNLHYPSDYKVMSSNTSSKAPLLATKLRGSIWNFGIFSLMFAVSDRSFAFSTNGSSFAVKLVQLFLVSLLLIAWICLKPKSLNEGQSQSTGAVELRPDYTSIEADG